MRVPVVRRVLVALATVMLLAFAGSAPVAAAGLAKPVVSVSATAAGTSVNVSVAINRAARQIAGCTYAIDGGPTTPCGGQTTGGSKSATITFTVSNQSGGAHTISVTAGLTDGGAGTGSASYTIATAGPFEVTCGIFGGVFSAVGTAHGTYQCDWATITSDRLNANLSTLALYCPHAYQADAQFLDPSGYVACLP